MTKTKDYMRMLEQWNTLCNQISLSSSLSKCSIQTKKHKSASFQCCECTRIFQGKHSDTTVLFPVQLLVKTNEIFN